MASIGFSELTDEELEVQLQEALESLDHLNPDVGTLTEIGDLYWEMKDIQQASAYYSRVVELDGGTKELAAKLARIFLVAKKPKLALEILRKGVEAFPDSAELQFELGKAYLAYGKKYAGMACLKKANELVPENNAYRFQLARAYHLHGKSDKALPLMEEVVKGGDANLETNLLYGRVLLVQGQERKAVRLLEKQLKGHSADDGLKKLLVQAYELYAHKEMNSGRLARAIKALESSLEIDADGIVSRMGVAMMYQDLGDLEKSESHFRLVLEKDDRQLGAYRSLGKILQTLGRSDESKDIYAQGLARAEELKDENFVSEFKTVLKAF